MAISTSTSWLNYTSTPSIVTAIPVKQLATDQTENVFGRTAAAITDTSRTRDYGWQSSYPVGITSVTPVKQLATDQTESVFARTSFAVTANTRNSYYGYTVYYPVTLSGYAPLATYALTGGSTNVAAAVIQIWKTGV